MRHCSFAIGRVLCPCGGYQATPKKGVCGICGHPASDHGSSAVLPLPADPIAGTSDGRPHLAAALFQHLLGSTPKGAIAIQETSNGLRKQQGNFQAKRLGTRVASQFAKDRSNPFRFRSVVFITCGLLADKESGLVELVTPTQIPGSHDIQVAARRGLAVTSTSERELFELNCDGTLPDINNFLRGNMPQLFDHLVKIAPWILEIDSSTCTEGDRIWPYVLLARRGRSLVPALLPNARSDPTVGDLRENCGRKGGSHSERVIFFATVNEISPKTVGKWVTTGSLNLENDTLSSDDNRSGSDVEILSPPQRRVTRSVSAKRGADKMEEDPSSSLPSLPPTKKARREAARNPIEEPLFAGASSPNISERPITPDTVTPPCPDEDYLLLENPWSEKIIYF